MIDETKRRILAAACNEKWHELITNPDFSITPWTGMYSCSCGCWVSIGDKSSHINRTFTTADDWELVRTTVVVPKVDQFKTYLYSLLSQDDKYYNGWNSVIGYWLTLSPEECCEIAADFVKANLNLFPEAEKIREIMEQEKDIIAAKDHEFEKGTLHG